MKITPGLLQNPIILVRLTAIFKTGNSNSQNYTGFEYFTRREEGFINNHGMKYKHSYDYDLTNRK